MIRKKGRLIMLVFHWRDEQNGTLTACGQSAPCLGIVVDKANVNCSDCLKVIGPIFPLKIRTSIAGIKCLERCEKYGGEAEVHEYSYIAYTVLQRAKTLLIFHSREEIDAVLKSLEHWCDMASMGDSYAAEFPNKLHWKGLNKVRESVKKAIRLKEKNNEKEE